MRGGFNIFKRSRERRYDVRKLREEVLERAGRVMEGGLVRTSLGRSSAKVTVGNLTLNEVKDVKTSRS